MNFTPEQIEQRYNSLPPIAKELMDSVQTGEQVIQIGDKNGLSNEETAILMDETSFVILGLNSPAIFPKRLMDELNLNQKSADLIVAQINEKVLNKLKTNPQQPSQTPPLPRPTPAPTPTPTYRPPVSTQPSPLDPILKAINSGEVYSGLRSIGEKYNLHLDQLSSLNKYTEMVMLGQMAGESFIKTISADLEVPNEIATNITSDINNQIITKVRQNMQKQTQPVVPPPPKPEPKPLTDLEKVGGFTIEKNSEAFTTLYTDSKKEEEIHIDEIEKEVPVTDISHLLQDHYDDSDKTELVTPEPATKIAPPPPAPKPPIRPYPVDPYREAI